MTAPRSQAATGATRADEQPVPENASTGQLISQLTEQLSRLVRDEARLAQAEMTQKAKKLGVGAGLFGGAGLVAFFGLAALITTAILALALVLPAWLAALIVAVALFAVAGVLALVGKKDVEKGSPPVPTEAISSVKTDISTVKESARR
ncbi:phage holin family protein [Blastococcus tunisiensis]|uniref:Putative Holin-X, holin superfamily III n=1 Tax=Blastococcus tunisiensis TaxID=1798228 RepID=A0A1I2GE74_9ACTN|nr:phage holin family protein [Blastococcus sp. DSM 46838]SFF15895.1 Putative Holin-X, holin superfamily III [Blastococcus sp. DSM 46838]